MPEFNHISWNALYVLDLLAIAHFVISYYRTCYRRGYRIDFWHSQLFLGCVLPSMLMLPFAKDELNTIVVGTSMGGIIAALPTVFLIALVGYVAILGGGVLWRLRTGLGLRSAAFRTMGIVPRCSMMLMSSRGILVFQAVMCIAFQWLLLFYYFSHSGFGFDLRRFTFENPTVRPVSLLISGYSVIIGAHCLARYVDTKERILLGCTLLLTFGLVFFGARSNLAEIYINVLLCYLVQLRSRISLPRLAALMGAIVIAAIYLGSVRAGDYSLRGFFSSLVYQLFYSGNFTDLRDFAWVYSGWDHVFWAGKTYLAAIIAFIPRFSSQFRDTWTLGPMTAALAGLDPELFTGLRPTIFGESYFNFGLAGVILVGLIVGAAARRVDIDTKRALAGSPPSMQKAFASTMLLNVVGPLMISAAFTRLYILAGVYLFSWFCLCAERTFHPRVATVH
jgi:oligosaccharide repeat unit polymerase